VAAIADDPDLDELGAQVPVVGTCRWENPPPATTRRTLRR